MKKLLVLLLLLYPLTAAAETYQWTDERGTVNFAEDLGKVPKKYRKKAKRLGAEEDSAVRIINEPQEDPAKAKKEEPSAEKKLYGGKDEATWRREFLQAEFNLKNAETDLSTLKGRLRDTSTMSRSEYLSIQNSIRYAEDRVQVQRKKLEQLQETADRLGVPADYRK